MNWLGRSVPFTLAAVVLAAGCGETSPLRANPDAGHDARVLLPSECGHDDCDGDGYSRPVDCDDGNPLVNPEAYDFVGDSIDNDCDGTADNPVIECETVPSAPPGAPTDFVRAGDLCAQRALTHLGVPFDPLVRAEWGAVSGTGGQQVWTSQTKPEQVAIVSSFGQNTPRLGTSMFGLANGPWGATDPRSSPALDPPGFHLGSACADIPLQGQDCASLTNNAPSSATSVQDWAELTLWVKVPSNATGMHFDFMFFSSEFSQFWGSSANDAFFALVSSKTISGMNVAKDSHGLGVTVSSDFFQLCPAPPGPAGISNPVALQQCVGESGDPSQSIAGSLLGTGYDGTAVGANDTVSALNGDTYIYGGGSGWLTAKFDVTPSEQLQLRFVIMDTFDGLKDSAVLIDRIGWDETPGGGVGRPPE